jgi:hypothetical protein
MQLDLFSRLVDKSNALIDALNDGRKPKEMYYGIEIIAVSDMRYLLVVLNREKQILFNIVDQNGDIPEGGGSCWRIWQHIEHELKITIEDVCNMEVVHNGAITKSVHPI